MGLGWKCGQEKTSCHAEVEKTSKGRNRTGVRSSVYRDFNLVSGAAAMFHT